MNRSSSLTRGFWAATLAISYQFQNPGGFVCIAEGNGFVAGNFIHNMAEAGNPAVLAGDDFAAGFHQFGFAASQSS